VKKSPSCDLDVIVVFYTLNMKGEGNLPDRINERRTLLLAVRFLKWRGGALIERRKSSIG